MQDQDKQKFAGIMTTLSATLGVTIDKTMLRGYWMALQDLDLQAFEKAAHKILTSTENTYGHIPVPGIFRKHALGDPAAKAATAWQVISDKIKCGAMPMIDYTITDPIAHAALKSLGGHSALGQAKPEEFDTWARKRFIDAYVAIAAEPIPEGLKGPIRGQCSMEMRGGVCWEHVTLNLETGEIIPKALSQGSEKFKALVAGVVENTSHE